MKKLATIIVIAIVCGYAGGRINNYFYTNNISSSQNEISTPSIPVNFRPTFQAESNIDFTSAAQNTIHAVTHIKSYSTSTANTFIDPFQFFFHGTPPPQQRNQTQASFGSGVIISNDGYIVTNNHVINNSEKIEVILNNKSTYEARVVGTDPTTDLAVLKIEERNLPFIAFGNSDNVKIGEWVLAVGNPFNLASTVTAGIISAKGRNINVLESDPSRGIFPIESFIQTDAAVNPGNSGGALVNTNGELIGINTAIASNTGNYAGYSFAIPVNIVQKVANDIKEFGEVQRAFLGISIRDIDSKLAKEQGLKILKGVFVAGVNDNSSANAAGIKESDVIRKVGNIDINSVPELLEQIGKYRPGDKINITIERNETEKILLVTLTNKNGFTDVIAKEKSTSQFLNNLGITLESISNDEKKSLKISGGAKVSQMKPGKIKNSGIKEGFIITKIDSKEVKEPKDVIEILGNKKGGVLIEGVYPNGMRAYYGFGI